MSNPARDISLCDIHHGMTVVDLGAGSGFHAFAASVAVGAGGTVYALEVQKELVGKLTDEVKRRHMPNIHVLWANFEKFNGTKLKDNSVDRVILANTLFQVEDKDTAVLEIKRILKPGGKVAVIDIQSGGAFKTTNYISEMDARILFEKQSFSIDKTFNYELHQWGFLATKQS